MNDMNDQHKQSAWSSEICCPHCGVLVTSVVVDTPETTTKGGMKIKVTTCKCGRMRLKRPVTDQDGQIYLED